MILTSWNVRSRGFERCSLEIRQTFPMFFPFFNQVDQAASHALKAQEIGGTVGFDVSGSLSDMAHGKCVHPPKKIYAYYEYGIVPHPKYAYNILVKASSAPSSSLNICNCIMYNAYLQLVTRVCLPEIPAGEKPWSKESWSSWPGWTWGMPV